MNEHNRPGTLTARHRIGYALGDFGGCMTFGLMAAFTTRYYINVAMIDTAVIAAMQQNHIKIAHQLLRNARFLLFLTARGHGDLLFNGKVRIKGNLHHFHLRRICEIKAQPRLRVVSIRPPLIRFSRQRSRRTVYDIFRSESLCLA